MKTVNLPPFAPKLIESTRAMGYSIEAAIADIIDNSITANCNNVWLSYKYDFKSYIAILDDGAGMSGSQITDAMRYGSQNLINERDKNDLGRFGLGLKTASLSQCRQLTIISKKNNEISARRWDFDYILKTGEWSLLILENEDLCDESMFEKLKTLNTGTLVIWKELDRLGEQEVQFEKSFLNMMTVVSEHLRLVFHRYLTGEKGLNKISIFMNNEEQIPYDPFLVDKSLTLMDTETIKIKGEKVLVTPYILPYLSQLKKSDLEKVGGKDNLRENQGFYIYRNKRLITWGTWFRLIGKGELSKLARVKVDIPNTLDHEWTLDVKKSLVRPPEAVRTNLGRIIHKIAGASENTFTFRGKKEVADENIRVWNRMEGRESVFYEVNRQNLLINEIIERPTDANQFKLESILKLIERNIPLHSIMVDFNRNNNLASEKLIIDEDAKKMLSFIVENALTNGKSVDYLLKMIEIIEPF